MLFLIGAAFGLRRGDRPFDRRLLACAIAANALVGIALPAICYALHPAWMWGYYVDPATVSPAVVVGLFALYWLPFALGLLTRSWWAIGGGLLAQGAAIAWQWPRYYTVVTLEQFRAGVQVPPAQIPVLNWGFLAAAAAMIALLVLARSRATDRP